MTVTVRDALPSDADAIADAHVRAWQVGYRGLVPDQYLDHPEFERQHRHRWHHRLTKGPLESSDPLNRIFVGVTRERVVGFGHAGRESALPSGGAERGELYDLYVHPDAWGTGVADALMAACLAELRTRFVAAVLWTLRDNHRSRHFCERTGWSLQLRDHANPIEEPWPLPDFPDRPPVAAVPTVQYRIDFA